VQFGKIESFRVVEQQSCVFVVFASASAKLRAYDVLSQFKERAAFAKQSLYTALRPSSYYVRRGSLPFAFRVRSFARRSLAFFVRRLRRRRRRRTQRHVVVCPFWLTNCAFFYFVMVV
jgi:hypothetical protein